MDNIQRLERQAVWIVDEDWQEYHIGAKCSNCNVEAFYDEVHGDVITPYCAYCGKQMGNYKELKGRE